MTEKQIIKRTLETVKPYRVLMAVSMLCMLCVAGFTTLQAYLVKPLIDKIFIEQDKNLLNILPVALIAVFLAKGIAQYTFSVLLEIVGQNVIKDLRDKIYTHLHSLPISYFHNTPTGELISRLISDVTLIQGAVSNAVVGILKDLFQAIGLLGVVFYMNWKLAAMSMVFLPAAMIPIIIFGRIHRRNSMLAQQTMASVSNSLHETIAGNRIVKAFCMEKYECGRFSKIIVSLYNVMLGDAKVRFFSHSLMEFIGGLFVAFIIWYGGREVLNGVSSPGTFFSFLTALIMFYEPIKGISKINSTVQQGMAAATRVFNILDTEPDIKDKPDAIDLQPMNESIKFRDISFSYDNNVTVLDKINLEVKKGESLALVGTSGAGKTTLANMVPRFFDAKGGQLLIDGHNIKDVTIKSLRNQIAMVTQQTILFNDTIRNNIAYGDPESSEEDIAVAAKAAYALEFINNLPDGFDTVIGEGGAKLSGGQQQRISIARALLKDAPILILDEATSALDTESERKVQRALENLMKNRTSIVIAHRLSTIRNSDRIVVMQNGKIVEEGSHNALLLQGGVYELLHNMQHNN